MKANNGGPAFPCHWRNQPNDAPQVMGMTLRDYFAAKVMQGLLSNSALMERAYQLRDVKEIVHNSAAEAYEMADVMLAEREK